MSQKSPWFSQEHDLFRQSVRQFVDTEVRPNMLKWEEDEKIPREVFQKMGELGFLGIGFPEAYGGTPADFFHSVILLEELARSTSAGLCAAQGVHQYMSTAHILKAGSDFLKNKYLPPAISGEKIGSLAISEPNAGSDVAAIRTTAKREGDYYVLNGSKTFITNGVYGDFVTVACKTDPSAEGVSGISLIVVDQRVPGFTVNKLKKMGWRASDTGELFFDNVKVPVENLIGQENMGFYYIMESFQLERLVAAIGAVAGCEAALEITLQYIHERTAFGRPIARFQAIRHTLSDLATEIEAAKQLVYYTAWLYDHGEMAVKECSMAKLLTSELGKKVADACLQCFGGYGYMQEYAIERMYRDARVGTIVGGTSEVMREIISKILIDEKEFRPAYGQERPKQKPDSPVSPSVNSGHTDQVIQSQSNKSEKMEIKPETARDIILSLENRFRPEKAEGVDSVFHFDIAGERGGKFTCKVSSNTCTVSENHDGEATCVITTTDIVYEDVELGRTNPQMALMMGKIKITNIGEMMKFIGLFRRLTPPPGQ